MSTPLESPPLANAWDRRSFIKITALAGGGLLLGISWRLDAADVPATGDFSPNAFIRIMPNGSVSLIAPNSEMGQGAKTALPMIIAEELDVPWKNVTVYQADLNPIYGRQSAVGSQSTQSNYTPLRQAGATGRALLVQAAAQSWGVAESECTTDQGVVLHQASNRRATYGELASKAATLPPPANVQLKNPEDFKLLGTRVPGVDNEKIVTGQPLFGIDVQKPGLLYAAYVKSHVFGASIGEAVLDDVKKLPGVKDAFVLQGVNGLIPGVAIVANSTWNAFSASQKLRVQWEESLGANQSSDSYAQQAVELNKGVNLGDLPAGGKNLEADYHYPYLAHATMEPQNCTALFKDGVMEMWCPSQVPSAGQGLVVRGLGLPASNVIVHVTRVGGGFGRRGSNEFSLEVAAIAQKMEGTPVKLTWSREHDMAHDNYRTAGWHFFRGSVDNAGKLAAWRDHFVTTGRNNQAGTAAGMNAGEFPGGFVADLKFQQSVVNTNVPTGYWRAPGANGNTWAIQSFIDELAHAAGRDPLEFRLDLLAAAPAAAAAPAGGGRGGRGGAGGGASGPRLSEVLRLAADRAGWGKKLPRGQGQGVAFSNTNGAFVAVIADVTVSKDGKVHIDKLTAAVNAGLIVNLSSAESQVQGSLIDGIGAAMLLKITIDKGQVQQANFDDYPLLRMPDAPTVVDVHFVKSVLPPTGLGEPALPPASAAVCNAIFAATGKRIRTLPFANEDLKWS